jgi:serine/threonine-protein kinase HipA
VFNDRGKRVFCAANRDDHVLQHAYLMDEKGEWHLAPAFDLTFANGPGGEHYMAVMGEGRDITRGAVEALGVRHGIAAKRIAAIVDEVKDAVAGWHKVAGEAGVSGSKAEIGGRLAAVNAAFA